MGWGDLLLAKYGKTRALATANPTLQFLGYSTSGIKIPTPKSEFMYPVGFYYNNPLTGFVHHSLTRLSN